MQDTELYIIAGVAADGAIGRRGDLIVHSREDMRYFKATTMGHPVIMGRKTFESLPKGALPGRRNIVITRSTSFAAPGVEVVHSLDEALALTAPDAAAPAADRDATVPFVIGGAQIYALAMPRATRLYLTEYGCTAPDAAAPLPAVDAAQWQRVSATPSAEGADLTFSVYERRAD